MSERSARKIRQTINRKTNKLAKKTMENVRDDFIFKISRQRDIIFLIALCELSIVIGLIIILIFRVTS